MAQTKHGAILSFCSRHNISVDDFNKKTSDGLKWCTKCKCWHNKNNFGKDSSRKDGLASSCVAGRRVLYSETYIKTGKTSTMGRRFKEVRCFDKSQSRHRVNHLVEIGLLPNPNHLPCSDCGHSVLSDGKKHEYHHYNGYDANNQETVIALCIKCHRTRHRKINNEKKQHIME
jgi:hypothetical protein